MSASAAVVSVGAQIGAHALTGRHRGALRRCARQRFGNRGRDRDRPAHKRGPRAVHDANRAPCRRRPVTQPGQTDRTSRGSSGALPLHARLSGRANVSARAAVVRVDPHARADPFAVLLRRGTRHDTRALHAHLTARTGTAAFAAVVQVGLQVGARAVARRERTARARACRTRRSRHLRRDRARDRDGSAGQGQTAQEPASRSRAIRRRRNERRRGRTDRTSFVPSMTPGSCGVTPVSEP